MNAPPLSGIVAAEWVEAAPDPEPRPLYRNPNFVKLWLATGIQLTVNSALQFVLIIRVIELTDAPLASVALVICLAAPPVVFGLGTGVIIDRLDKRDVLALAAWIRAGLTALLLVADNVSVAAIFGVAFLTATAGQFALPAGAAAVPNFVPRRQLLSANTAFQFTTTSTQLIGLVVLSPIMLQVLDFDTSYILSAVLIFITVPLLLRLPSMKAERDDETDHTHRRGEALDRLRATAVMAAADVRSAAVMVWRDRLTASALVQLITGVMLLFMFAVLVPDFVHDVIGRDREDAVFVFWPTGVGALLTLVALPRLGKRFRETTLASAGLAVVTIVVTMFGVLDFLRSEAGGDAPWLLGATLIMAFFLGFAYAVINAPAQTIIHRRAPPEMRGRLFSAQLMMANAVSMAALVIVGGVSDAAGVRQALFLLGGGVFVITLLSIWLGRPGDVRDPPRVGVG